MITAAARITIPHGGIEYIHWTLTGLPDAPPTPAVHVTLDGHTWHPAVMDGQVATLLIAHPDAPATPGAVTVPAGRYEALVRLTDTPEVVIRPGGLIVMAT